MCCLLKWILIWFCWFRKEKLFWLLIVLWVRSYVIMLVICCMDMSLLNLFGMGESFVFICLLMFFLLMIRILFFELISFKVFFVFFRMVLFSIWLFRVMICCWVNFFVIIVFGCRIDLIRSWGFLVWVLIFERLGVEFWLIFFIWWYFI